MRHNCSICRQLSDAPGNLCWGHTPKRNVRVSSGRDLRINDVPMEVPTYYDDGQVKAAAVCLFRRMGFYVRAADVVIE